MNLATLLLGLVIKPAVMISAIVVLFQLRKRVGMPGHRALVWGTLAFLLGETACGVNVYGTKAAVLAFEGTHEVMMALAAIGWVRGLHQALSSRFGCPYLGCDRRGDCARDPLGCDRAPALDLLTLGLLLGGIGLALLPTLTPLTVHDQIFEAGVGDRVMGSYAHHRGHAEYLLQQLVLPGVAGAALVLATAWALVQRRLDRVAWWLLHVGAGVGGFAWMRVVLATAFFPHAQRAAVIEEVLELAGVLLMVLWLRSLRLGGRSEGRGS